MTFYREALLLFSAAVLFGCGCAKDMKGGMAVDPGKAVSDLGANAHGAVSTAGGMANGAANEVGKTSVGVASGIGSAANNVREGMIDTFGVREQTVTRSVYFEKEKQITVLPSADMGQPAPAGRQQENK